MISRISLSILRTWDQIVRRFWSFKRGTERKKCERYLFEYLGCILHSYSLFPLSNMLNFRYRTGLTSSITACIRMLLNSRCRFLEDYFYVFLESFSFFLRISLQKQSYSSTCFNTNAKGIKMQLRKIYLNRYNYSSRVINNSIKFMEIEWKSNFFRNKKFFIIYGSRTFLGTKNSSQL